MWTMISEVKRNHQKFRVLDVRRDDSRVEDKTRQDKRHRSREEKRRADKENRYGYIPVLYCTVYVYCTVYDDSYAYYY